MRVLQLEYKKILQSRRTWVMILLSLLCTVMFAYMPVTFVVAAYCDENGNVVELKGKEAIAYKKTIRSDMTGEVTGQKIRLAWEQCQECLREYGVETIYELPEEIYCTRILPVLPIVSGMREAFADPDTGMALPYTEEVAPQRIEDFYAVCSERLVSLMKMEEQDSEAAQKQALSMFSKVEKPYQYYAAGYNGDAMDYELLLAMLLLLFCIVLAAPSYSIDYQTKADDILRCTKHGRFRLGAVKMVSVASITGILFIGCMLLYLLISNNLFGWECTKTSVQMLYSITNLVNWNIGQLQWAVLLAGLLSVIATVCFTLFLSSRCSNVMTSLAVGFAMYIAPFLIYLIIPGEIGLWMRCLLPSCGVILQSSFLFAVVDYQFLTFGGGALWTPYAILLFSAVSMAAFTVMGICSYVKRESA